MASLTKHPLRFLVLAYCVWQASDLTTAWQSCARAEAIIYSPVQATARPMGLGVVNPVQVAGSDAASQKFLTDLPAMQSKVVQNLPEYANNSNRIGTGGLIALDPNALKLTMASDVRVYFVGEGAGYHNSLGFNTAGEGVSSGNPLLVFPDVSSPTTYMSSSSGTGKRTASEPLMPGDFVNLGTFGAGTQLDFFLISNGVNGGKDVFSTESQINPDHINHVVSFAQVDSPYILISFEDMKGGGDKDYNDAVFAVYLGKANVQALLGVPAPEPGFIWLVVAGCGGWLYRTRRKKLAKASGSK